MSNIYGLKPALEVTDAMVSAGLRQHPMPPQTMRSILENALCYAELPKSVPLYKELDRGIPD